MEQTAWAELGLFSSCGVSNSEGCMGVMYTVLELTLFLAYPTV